MLNPLVRLSSLELDRPLIIFTSREEIISWISWPSDCQETRLFKWSECKSLSLFHSLSLSLFPLLSFLFSSPIPYDTVNTKAGVERDDLSVYECHDAFAIIAVLSLEAMGFVPRGETPRFAAEGTERERERDRERERNREREEERERKLRICK
jgi:hypothetical protein